jgi:flagellar hook-associated protein 3 FlgL
MGVRIVPEIYYSTLLAAVAEDRQQVSTALQQVATGRRVNSPSDDPIAAANLVANLAESANIDQFTRSVSGVQGSLQTADSALNSVVNSLTQSIALGTEGANGTLSADNRQTLATQVDNLQQEILGLANTTYQGEYVFAGTSVKTQAFAADSSSPSGVTYNGNNNANQIQVGLAQSVTANKPGSQIFNGAGADVFQALHDLASALRSNGDIAGATAEIQSALNNVDLQRTFYSATLDRLNNASTTLSQEKVDLSQQQSDLVGADLATSATNLAQAQTTLNAALAAFGRISQNSLLDYLK